MNKRIKLKKGLLHKKCSDNCWVYSSIKSAGLFTNMGFCDSCKFKKGKAIKELLEANMPSNVRIATI